LVAYILPEKEWNFDEPLSDTLKSYLRVHLPEYMLPSIFVPIAEIPLTPNGKVDRRKLPAPDQSLLAVTTPYEAPRSSNEHILAELWAEVIGFTPSEERPTIGIHDNFFELGGDSILSIQVISRAAEAGLQLTPRQLFEYPTIAGLAALAVAGNQPEGNNISTSFSQASQSTEMNLDQVVEREMAEFGWNEEDITDILDAIQGAIGDDEQDPGEENMSELK
jgi:aryl carrier-like protein